MHKPSAWADRYSRQTRFAPIGTAGQARLHASGVLIVGCGALGASLAQHMTRAGVGTVRIVDRDFVEPSNLQRQMLFDEADALDALPKAVAAAGKLRRINSEITIEHVVADVTKDNARQLADGMDIVLDGTDNAATRLLLSEVCFSLGIPFLYGGVAGSQGMSAVLVPGETACLRCLIGGAEDGEAAETRDTVGVISPIVEWIAAIQSAEALKWLSGGREALRRTWLTANLWPYRVHESALPKPSASCSCCGSAALREGAAEGAAGLRAEAGTVAELATGAAADPASDAVRGGKGGADARETASREGGERGNGQRGIEAVAADVTGEASRAGTRAANESGETGPAGARAASVPGEAGSAGAPAASVSGEAGPAGAPASGVSGEAAPAGAQAAGVSGEAGPAGAPAASVSGEAGSAGAPAASESGEAGSAGAPAASVSGEAGPAGAPAAGMSGVTGPAGPQPDAGLPAAGVAVLSAAAGTASPAAACAAGGKASRQDTAAAPPRTVALCGRDSVQVTLGFAVELTRLREHFSRKGCEVTSNPYLVRAHLEDGIRLAVFPDGRVLVQGTQDAALALALCAQWIELLEVQPKEV